MHNKCLWRRRTSDVTEIGSKKTSGTWVCFFPLCPELGDADGCRLNPWGGGCDLCPPNKRLDQVRPIMGENGEEPFCDPKMSLVVESLTAAISSCPPNVAAKIPSRIDIRNPRMKTHWFWFWLLWSRYSCHDIKAGCRVDELRESLWRRDQHTKGCTVPISSVIPLVKGVCGPSAWVSGTECMGATGVSRMIESIYSHRSS